MGYNSPYRQYNPIASAVDTAATLQDVFNSVEDRKRRQEEMEFQRGITLREQSRADNQDTRAAAQDARAAEAHALDLKGKQQAYDESAETIRKRKENEQIMGEMADFLADPENAAVAKIWAQNKSLSNNPEKALKQGEAFERIEQALPQISPYLLDPSKRTLVTDQQFPDFFRDFNIAYGPTINKGTDANGERGAFKYVNAVTSDNNNNLSFGLLVKPKNGDAYTSAVTADRGGNPDAPVVQTPAQGAGLHARAQSQFIKAGIKPFLARLARNGDKDALTKLENILNEESMQDAYVKAKAEIEAMQKANPKLKLSEYQKRQILLDKVPDTNTWTTKERGAWAKERFDENLVTVGKGQKITNTNNGETVAVGAPDIESVPYESDAYLVSADGTPPKKIKSGHLKPTKGTSAKSQTPEAQLGMFDRMIKQRMGETMKRFVIKNEGWDDLSDQQKEALWTTPNALTDEGKKVYAKLKKAYNEASLGIARGKISASQGLEYYLTQEGAPDAPAAPAAAAPAATPQKEEGGFWSGVKDFFTVSDPKAKDTIVPTSGPKKVEGAKGMYEYAGSKAVDAQKAGLTASAPKGKAAPAAKPAPRSVDHKAVRNEVEAAMNSGKVRSMTDAADYLVKKYPGTYANREAALKDLKLMKGGR